MVKSATYTLVHLPEPLGGRGDRGDQLLAYELDCKIDDGLVKGLLVAEKEGAHVVLTSSRKGVLGVFVPRTEYELLCADARLIRDAGRFEFLSNYDTGVKIVTIDQAFEKKASVS